MNKKQKQALELVHLGIHLGLHKVLSFDASIIFKVKKLALKHKRLCEMSCNGVGYLKGRNYYCGTIDAYARREYGANVQSAYVSDDETIFDVEISKTQEKIKSLLNKLYEVDFQHDPRGNTVKLYLADRWINLDLF